MSYTRAQYADAFLTAIGAPLTTINRNFVIAWSQYETRCCGGAAFNLLNTTEQNTPGVAGFFNCLKHDTAGNCLFGVMNYDSFSNGVVANAKVLQNGFYPNLLTALRNSDRAALCNPGSSIASELSIWGTGNATAIGNAACSGNVQAGDTFSGTATSVPGGTNAQGATGNASTSGCPDCSKYNPLFPDQTPAWAACMTAYLACQGGAVSSGISAASAFFQLLGPWLGNPARLIKLVLGILGLGIGIFALFWPALSDVVMPPTKKVLRSVA